MPRLTCIIPVVGSTEGLEITLVSVLEHRPDDCEVLVVLNTSYDDPYKLQGEIQFITAPASASVVGCLNLGIAASRAQVVHFLAAGMEVSPGWAECSLAHFADPRVAAVTPIILDAADRQLPLATGIGYDRSGRRVVCRSLAVAAESPLASVGPTIRTAFYRKSALDATGQRLPDGLGGDLVDVDLALTLRSAGWNVVIEPECRIFAPPIDETHPDGFHWGLWSERLFWRHAKELGLLGSLARHLLAVVADLARVRPWWKAPGQLAGRLGALFQLGYIRQYRKTLTVAKVEAAIAQTAQTEAKSPARGHAQRRLDSSHAGTPRREIRLPSGTPLAKRK